MLQLCGHCCCSLALNILALDTLSRDMGQWMQPEHEIETGVEQSLR